MRYLSKIPDPRRPRASFNTGHVTPEFAKYPQKGTVQSPLSGSKPHPLVRAGELSSYLVKLGLLLGGGTTLTVATGWPVPP